MGYSYNNLRYEISNTNNVEDLLKESKEKIDIEVLIKQIKDLQK